MFTNQLYALKDVGPLLNKSFALGGRKNTTAYMVTHHADLTTEISTKMGIKVF